MTDIYDVLDKRNEMQSEEDTHETWEPEMSREEYKEMKEKERQTVYDMVDAGLSAMTESSEYFQEYLATQARLDRYSVANVLLIMKQAPQAVQLKAFDEWNKEGVSIKKGEHPIMILKAYDYVSTDGRNGVGFNVKKVFDISQTNARQKVFVHSMAKGRELLEALIEKSPVPMRAVEAMEAEKGNAYFDPNEKIIFIRRGLEAEVFFTSVAQEMAYAELYQEGKPYSRDENEFKAKCAAYMLCSKYDVAHSGLSLNSVPERLSDDDHRQLRSELTEARNVFTDMNERMREVFRRQHREKKEVEHER